MSTIKDEEELYQSLKNISNNHICVYMSKNPPKPPIANYCTTWNNLWILLYSSNNIKQLAFSFENLVCWGNIYIQRINCKNTLLQCPLVIPSYPHSIHLYAQKNCLQLIQITSVLSFQQHWKFNPYFFINIYCLYVQVIIKNNLSFCKLSLVRQYIFICKNALQQSTNFYSIKFISVSIQKRTVFS